MFEEESIRVDTVYETIYVQMPQVTLTNKTDDKERLFFKMNVQSCRNSD